MRHLIREAERMLREGHLWAAEETCDNILRDSPPDFPEKGHVLRLLGITCRRRKSFTKALNVLLEALELGNDEDAELWVQLAQVFKEVGKPACAAECYKSAAERDKPRAKKWLKQAIELSGVKTSAEERAVAAAFLRELEINEGHVRSTIAYHVLRAERALNARLRNPRIVSKSESYLHILRGHSSYTPILQGREGRGGGYLLVHGGKGCIVDPGYGFIQNFLNAGYGFGDIHAIVVTHAHDDHIADLLAISSILHKKEKAGRTIDLYLDGTSYAALGKHYLLGGGQFSLKKRLQPRDRDIEIFIDQDRSLTMNVYKAKHDVPVLKLNKKNQPVGFKFQQAVGLEFRFGFPGEKSQYILFPSDTGWNDKIAGQYLTLEHEVDVALLHISSIKPCEQNWLYPDVPSAKFLYPQHLGLIGVTRFVDRVRPRMVLLGERGAELDDVWEDLAEVIGKACGHRSVYATKIGTKAILDGCNVKLVL